MTFRYQGQKARWRASEINRINQLADLHARGELNQRGKPDLPPANPNARIVLVQNDSGADRDAFDCMALDGLLWALEDDGTSDVVFSAIAADPDKQPAILIEPIEDGGWGFAVVDGLALATVSNGAAAETFAVPNATNHNLEPARAGSILLLDDAPSSGTALIPVVLNTSQSSSRLVMTPAGGIPAMTESSGTYTFGSATCTFMDLDDSSGLTATNTAENVTVYNSVTFAIDGSVVIQAKQIEGHFFVDVTNCSGA